MTFDMNNNCIKNQHNAYVNITARIMRVARRLLRPTD